MAETWSDEQIKTMERNSLIAENAKLRASCQQAAKCLEDLLSFCGGGLHVQGWHLNGDTEPFDNFFDENGAQEALDSLCSAINKEKAG